MISGAPVNHTEKRPVLHTALRYFGEEALKVQNTDIRKLVSESRTKIKDISSKIRSGKWKGSTGQPIKDVVHLGIGGSSLGPKTLYEAFRQNDEPVRIHFISNIDAGEIDRLIQKLDAGTTLIVVVSKTFTTVETLLNARIFKKWLDDRLPGQDTGKHLIAVSANRKKAMEFGVPEENILDMWDWVGGRFSVWSAVGISSAIGLGYDAFEDFLKGAYAMDRHFIEADFSGNIPVMSALLTWWNVEMNGTGAEAVIPYSEKLKFFPAMLQQLVMESNGKSVDKQGKPVNYATSPVIFGVPGTDAQHSFMQLIHQGTNIVPVDFIGFKENEYPDYPESHALLNANMHAQRKALAFGKTADKVHLDMKIAGQEEDIERLLAYKIFPGNRPSNLYLLDRPTPYALGMIWALYEHKTFVTGALWNINSFDQFGVELGKELAKKGLLKNA